MRPHCSQYCSCLLVEEAMKHVTVIIIKKAAATATKSLALFEFAASIRVASLAASFVTKKAAWSTSGDLSCCFY